MIEELLEKLDLTPKEAVVYLVLFGNGRLTASQASLRTKFRRTTTYSVLESLVGKGLVGKDLGGKVEAYYPHSPEKLVHLVDIEEGLINKKKELAKRAVRELRQLGFVGDFSIPKITFVTGKDVEKFLYNSTEKWNASIIKYDGIMWGFSNPEYVKEFQAYIEWYWKNTSENIKLKVFSASAEIESQISFKYPRRQIKQWPGPNKFNSTFLICGDFLVMEYTDHQPHYLIEIHDKFMAENLREFFRVIWQLVK